MSRGAASSARTQALDEMFRDVLAASGRRELLALLAERSPDEPQLLALLRRAVPVALLEALATTPPWSESARVLGGVARNPRTPPRLALRVLPELYWRDQAEVAQNLVLAPAVRARAESLLLERLPGLRLGDRLSLARIATPALLRELLRDTDRRVVDAALESPRLTETELVLAVQRRDVPPRMIERALACASPRWRQSYSVRLAIARQPKSPLGVVLGILTSLDRRDLLGLTEMPGLAPLVQAGALRAARGRENPRG